MIYNSSFTTYRLTGTVARSYSGTATLTNAEGFFEPLSGELRAVLGIDNSVMAWALLTEASDIQRQDKVVILSNNYFVEQIEQFSHGAVNLTRLVLLKDV